MPTRPVAPHLPRPILHPEALEAAIAELRNALHDECDFTPSPKVSAILAKRILRVYVHASKIKPKNVHDRLAPGTRALMDMQPGDVKLFPATALQVFRCRMRTARRFMENPDARWQAKQISKAEVRVKRLEDGAPYETDPWDTPRVVFLAQLPVGKPTLTRIYKDRQSMSSGTKMSARKLLGNPDANWSAKTTKKGIIVTRTQ